MRRKKSTAADEGELVLSLMAKQLASKPMTEEEWKVLRRILTPEDYDAIRKGWERRRAEVPR